MHLEKKIKVLKGDIFNYIVGRKHAHRIEAFLDIEEEGRYEVHQTFIYDSKIGAKEVQDLNYLNFFMEVEKFRHRMSTKINPRRSEILRISEELAEISPETIKLPSSDFPKVNSKVAEIFDLKNFNQLKYLDAKMSEEDLLKNKPFFHYMYYPFSYHSHNF